MHREDATTPEQYVLKRLKNRDRIARFSREVKAGMALDHPNVLKVVDYDLEHDGPYFVAEYCQKGPLSKADLSGLDLIRRLRLFQSICSGVGHAHAKGVVHRDLKPDNIYLRADGSPVVGDFGICFVTEGGERITLIDEAAGSRNYMAPELENGRVNRVDLRSDVYSLGKLLYWILSGQVFAREKHREPDFDLTKKWRRPYAIPYYLVNELLDRMIVADASKRLEAGITVYNEVEALIQRILARAHPIDLDAPQICLYCGDDYYKEQVNGEFQGSGEIGQIQQFGFRPVNPSRWLILVCPNCGNVQIFRPDHARNQQIWQRSKESQ